MRKINVLLMAGIAVSLIFLSGCGSDSETAEVAAKSNEHEVGEALYKQNCKVCHAQGLNGAPILGNKKMWGPRAEQGATVLVQHAVNGFGLMPAKGGKTDLTEEEIAAVVGYMLSQLE